MNDDTWTGHIVIHIPVQGVNRDDAMNSALETLFRFLNSDTMNTPVANWIRNNCKIEAIPDDPKDKKAKATE